MKKLQNKYLAVILVLILTIPAFWSIAKPGYFPMHDDMQAMRTLQMRKCLLDGQIPCRWVPDMGYGYGYPQFNFYGPLPYYFMAGLTFLGLSILDSVKIGFIITIPISALGMYFLAREFWGRLGSIISALLFVYAPYRAVDMYVRGAVGEFWALSFLPFIFLFLKRLIEGKKYSVLGLSIFLSLLLITHNITSMITAPFLVLWIVYFAYFQKKHLKEVFQKLMLSGLWSISLSAFYLLPAWFEKKYVHVDTIIMGYFDYRRHFISLAQLFLRSFWGYGTSDLGPRDEIFLGVGLVHLVFAALSLLALFVAGLFFREKPKKIKTALVFLGLFLLSVFMAHSRSSFVWRALPLLEFVQFPWRFLTLSILFISLLGGAIGNYFKSTLLTLFLAVGLLSLFTFSFFKPETIVTISDQEKFSGELWEKQQTISIFDYLPIYADKPPADAAQVNPILESGELLVNDVRKGSDWLSYDLSVVSDQATIRLPQYYFPGTNLLVNGENTSFDYRNELGLPTFSLYRGEHLIYLSLNNTWVRSLGNVLTVAGFGFFLIYWFKLKHG